MTRAVATLCWLWGGAAWSAPVEMPDPAPQEWREAATLTGFELGPCVVPPCARLREGRIELWLSEEAGPELLPLCEPEVALAIAASRVALAPASSAAGERPPAETPTEVAPQANLARAPQAESLDEPMPVEPMPVEPSPTERTPKPGPASPPATDPVASVVSPPREPSTSRRANRWLSIAGGVADAPVVQLHAGAAGTRIWWGVGTRLDGRFTLETGAGVTGTLGEGAGWNLGLWGGAENTPQECWVCTVEKLDGQPEVESGMFANVGAPGWHGAARAEVSLAFDLGPRVVLGPRAGAVATTLGVRPDLALALRWSTR